jgi:adenylosuccinate synthase
MASESRIVLLSGAVAVGKTTLRQELLSSHGFDYVRSSGYLMQLAKERGMAASRTALQDLGDELDMATDYRWVVDDVARPAIAVSPHQQLWLVDAVRKERQVSHFRDAFAGRVLHVHLHADECVIRARYEARQIASAEQADFTPYDVAVQHENEVLSRALISRADLVIDTSAVSPAESAERIKAALLRLDVR